MAELKVPFNLGLVTARGAADLQPGELTAATGIFYAPGDPDQARRIPAALTYGTPVAARTKGLALCQFDDGGSGGTSDVLLALTGPTGSGTTTLYKAAPNVASGSLPATFTALSMPSGVTLSTSSSQMSSCHCNDRWYLATGYDPVLVMENDATTVRRAGMKAPTDIPTVTVLTTNGTLTRAGTSTSTWTSASSAYDASATTFAYATRNTAGSTVETWGWASGGSTTGTLYIQWSLAGTQSFYNRSWYGVGGGVGSGFSVRCKIEYSTDGGVSYPAGNTILNRTMNAATPQTEVLQVPITSVNLTTSLKVRATLTYVTTAGKSATFRIYNIYVSTLPATASFIPDVGFYYAYTEFDETRGIESAPSPVSALATNPGMVGVTLTLPGSASVKNTNVTTHFRIYRTADGGTPPQDLGLVGKVVPTATSTSFTDDFVLWDGQSQPLPIVRLQKVSTDQGGDIYFPMDDDPPLLRHINYYKGSLVGTTVNEKRALYYSEPGYPESWPEGNVIAKFPIPERDELVATATVGDTLLIACTNAMLTMNDLPRVLDGSFNASEVTPLRGQPGCVGMNALTTYSVAGEARAAWVSLYGVHETNGISSRKLSTDLDWTSLFTSTANLANAVLFWDAKRLILKLFIDTDASGTNDKVYFFHMAPEQQKDTGPKITLQGNFSYSCAVGGVVSGVYRQFTGSDTSSGIVRLEHGDTTYLGLTMTSGRIYGPSRFWCATKGNVRHNATSASVTVTFTAVDEANGESSSPSNSNLDFSADGSTEFWINRLAEYATLSLTCSDAAVDGAFLDCRLATSGGGPVGRLA